MIRLALTCLVAGYFCTLAACSMTLRDLAVNSANVLQASGEVGGKIIDTCTVVARREAAAATFISEHPDEPEPLHMSDGQVDAMLAACDQVELLYDAVQRNHAALRSAILLAEEVEKTGATADWSEVSALVADSLALVEQLRQAVAAAKAVVK